MKKVCLAPVLVALLLGAAAAQKTYDISSYVMLKPGSFHIAQERKPGGVPFAREAVVVKRLGKYILQYRYQLDLKNNVKSLDEAEIFELTPADLLYHGHYDFTTGKANLLNPPLRVPRQLPLDQPVTYTGTQGTTPLVITIVITADQVSYTTPRNRTFTGCLRVKFTTVTDREVEASLDVMAPNQVGTVYSLWCDIDQTQPEPRVVDPGIDEYIQP